MSVKQILLLGLLGSVLTCTAGCELAGVLLADPEPKTSAKYPGLNHGRVVVLTYAQLQALMQHPALQLEVSQGVTHALREALGEETQLVEALESAAWLDEHPDWHGIPLDEIGRQFEADFVVYIEISRFSLREPGSTMLYRGQVQSTVMVVETARGDAPVFRDHVDLTEPIERVISATEIPRERFKRKILNLYTQRVARLFHDYRTKRKSPG